MSAEAWILLAILTIPCFMLYIVLTDATDSAGSTPPAKGDDLNVEKEK